ncbi:MAG: sigma-E factor negative regulatory protein [Clostridia bacterium]
MKERISELMDGELEPRAARQAIDALQADAEALDTWRRYQLISDAMRDTPLLSAGFAARVAARLEREPTVVAPGRLAEEPRRSPPWVPMPAAVAASLAALALVGWLAFAPQAPAPVPLAQVQPEKKALPEKPQNIPLPAATPDYLLAHQGFSPRVSLQGMAAYARTVSDEATEGAK